MSYIYQRVMSDGAWTIELSPDTPRALLDKLTPFTCHIVITPAEIDIGSTDAVFLAAARYVGPIRRIGKNRLSPGGPGNSMWLSDPDGKGELLTSALSAGTPTLSGWISALLPSSLTPGTITSPGGTFSNTYQWVTKRQAIDSVCRAFGVEWRVNNDFTFDAGTVDDLYRSVADGDTPAAIVARGFGGRDPQIVGIRSDVQVDIDWDDYVSLVYVIGQGSGFVGGITAFRKPTGATFSWGRVVEDPTAPPGSLNNVAAAVFAQLPTATAGRREVTVSTDLFDVSGDVTLGDDVWVWDPENGIVDTSNQVTYQGQLISPVAMRLIGVGWPVRRGMGVYLREQNASFTPTYYNLTPYVEFDESAATLELGAASRRLTTDSAGQLVTATGPVGATPWLTYTPTVTNGSVGNGTIHGFFRREGTTLHLRIRFTLGSTSTITGALTISLPSGVTAVAETDGFQLLPAILRDTGTTVYHGIGQVTSGATSITMYAQGASGTFLTQNAISGTVPHTWASTDVITVNGTLEVQP